MNHADKMDAARDIFGNCLEILDRKGRDYSGTTDGMGSFRTHGSFGIVVRLHDKMCRLNQLYTSGLQAVTDESIDDTLDDLINYAALTKIMRAIEKGEL